MVLRLVCCLALGLPLANAFSMPAQLPSHHCAAVASSQRAATTEMVLGYKLAAGAARCALTQHTPAFPADGDAHLTIAARIYRMCSAAVVGTAVVVKKRLASRKDPAVESFRSSLSSMDSLSSLNEMKLETEGKAGRVAGQWKECEPMPPMPCGQVLGSLLARAQ